MSYEIDSTQTSYYDDYLKQLEQDRLSRQLKREGYLGLLFSNGLVTPSLSKLNREADVSAWLNYESVYSKVTNFYRVLGGLDFLPKSDENSKKYSLLSMRMDSFF